jgi:hypothetical protein
MAQAAVFGVIYKNGGRDGFGAVVHRHCAYLPLDESAGRLSQQRSCWQDHGRTLCPRIWT